MQTCPLDDELAMHVQNTLEDAPYPANAPHSGQHFVKCLIIGLEELLSRQAAIREASGQVQNWEEAERVVTNSLRSSHHILPFADSNLPFVTSVHPW